MSYNPREKMYRNMSSALARSSHDKEAVEMIHHVLKKHHYVEDEDERIDLIYQWMEEYSKEAGRLQPLV